MVMAERELSYYLWKVLTDDILSFFLCTISGIKKREIHKWNVGSGGVTFLLLIYVFL